MIESLENKKVKAWTKLHQKKYRGEEFLLCEERLILAAREKGCLKTLVYTGNRPFEFEDAYEVSREVLNKIAKSEGVSYIGIGRPVKPCDAYKNRVIVLEDLSDPLNIGRIIEAAYLFGFDSVLLSPGCADIYHPKCLSASKGNIFRIGINIADLQEELPVLKEKGFRVYATGLRDNTLSLDDVKPEEKMAVILGNEGSGVKEETFRLADEIIKIDMHNIDSLNVAMAGAIIMYRFSNT